MYYANKMFFVFILANLAFLWLFYQINFLFGIYAILFFLILVILLSFFSEEGKKSWGKFIKDFILEYLSYINWLILIAGLFFIFYFFLQNNFPQKNQLIALIILIGINIFTILLGGFFNKENFIKLGNFGLLLLWSYLGWIIKDWKIFNFYIGTSLVSNYLAGLIKTLKGQKFGKFLLYNVGIFTIISLVLIIQSIIHNPILISLLVQILVFVILFATNRTQKILNKLYQIEKKQKEIEYELNVFGYTDIKLEESEEKFLEKYKKYQKILENYLDIVLESPLLIKILFALTNTIPIVFASFYFFSHLGNKELYIQNEILYWIGSALFFVNFLLFKKLNWFVGIQRFFAFFVINFVSYFTIIDFFGDNYLYIAFGGIIWNIFSTLLILLIGKKEKFLDKFDYLNWILVNFLAVGANIYFLFKTDLVTSLKYGFMLLYLGLYLALFRVIYRKIF